MASNELLESTAVEELIGQISDEFATRLRNGECPKIEEYAIRYPKISETIRRVLPAVEAMCELTAAGDSFGPSSDAERDLHGRLGDFQILREIGRGGMGIVYEAEQISVGRPVALKVLPFAAVLDQKHLQRFKNEAVAAGTLDHPNIVPVYSVGSDRGVHYYAMRFVEGQSLADCITQLREHPHRDVQAPNPGMPETECPAVDTHPIAGLTTEDSARLPTYFHTVASLGAQAADALQHAHEVGLIHRDIKPSNLLVSRQAHLWVIDFGLARMPGANLTLTGDLLGTLRYMSPEQAAGTPAALDHRTDIYSLGATLYELATLRPAFAGTDRRALLRQIAEVEPRSPRRLNREIPPDLETIILKAMAKQPAGRYASALEMADDLRRFLSNRPISARRPSVFSQGAKWVRRNAVLLAAIAATLVICLSLSTLLLWRSRGRTMMALDSVRTEQKRTRQALSQSDANWQLARRAVDDMYTQVAQQWLDDQPHMTKVQRDFLTKAADFYERLPSHRQGDRELRHEAASAQLRAGRIRFHLGQYGEAAGHLEKSVVLFDQLGRDNPGHQGHARSLAQALESQGDVLKAQGKLGPAAQSYTRSIEFLSKVVVPHPEDGDAQRELMRTQISLGQVRARAGKREEAIRLLRDVVTSSTEGVGLFQDDLDSQRRLVRAMSVLAGIVPDNAESESLLRQSIEICEKLVAVKPSNRDVQYRLNRCHAELAHVMFRTGRSDEAVDLLRLSIESCGDLAENYPDVLAYRMGHIADSVNLSSVLSSAGGADEAESAARDAVSESRSLLEDFPNNVSCRKRLITALILHSWILQRIGRESDSPQPLHEAVAQCHELADLSPTTEDPNINLGSVACEWQLSLTGYALPRELANIELSRVQDLLVLAYSRLFFLSSKHDLDKSLEYCDKIIAIYPKSVGAYCNKGHLYRIHEKYEGSVRALTKALELSPANANTHAHLGLTYFLQGRYEAAVEAYSRVIQLRPEDGNAHRHRGMLYLRLGRYEEAEADLNELLNLRQEPTLMLAWLLVTGPPAVQDPERALAIADDLIRPLPERKKTAGVAHYRLKQYEDAKTALLEAAKTSDSQSIRSETLFFLAMVCQKLGAYEEASRRFDEAVEWMQRNASPEDIHLRRIRDEAAALLSPRVQIISPRDNGPLDSDPRVDRLLVGNQTSTLNIRLFGKQTNTSGPPEHAVRVMHDDRVLRPELDYRVRHQPADQTLEVQPAAGVFASGVYRFSMCTDVQNGELPGNEIAIVVSRGLTVPKQVTFQEGGDGKGSLVLWSQQALALVASGATWRYLDDGSDQGVAWRETQFDDSEWNTGPAQLGYGDGDETTTIHFGPDPEAKFPTYYFRHKFQVDDPQRLSLLRLRLLCDDGAIVYLNGKELVRYNLPSDVTHSTYAVGSLSYDEESEFVEYSVGNALLLNGANCLAAEVHQGNAGSSDVSFDLELVSPEAVRLQLDDPVGTRPQQIPAATTVTAARLRLHMGESGPADLQLARIRDERGPYVTDELPCGDAHDFVTFDVTATVQGWCDGQPNRGWFLVAGDGSTTLRRSNLSPEFEVQFMAPKDQAKLAWHFANCVDVDLRDPKLALEYAQRAVADSASDAYNHTALGAAFYRNGQWDEAITALEKAAELNAHELRVPILLAMTHWQCGNVEKAREIYRGILGGIRAIDLQDGELAPLRAEAEQQLTRTPAAEGNSTME